MCGRCAFYTKRGISFVDGIRNSIFGLGCDEIGFCMAMTDSYGNPRKVKGLDSCKCGAYTPKY